MEELEGTDRFHRYPVKDGLGGVFYLSEREHFICEALLQSGGSISFAAKSATERFKRPMAYGTVKRWMTNRPQIGIYLRSKMQERADYADLDKEKFFGKLYSIADQDKKVNSSTYLFWKLIGQMKGFLEQEGNKSVTAIQINLRQGNGQL